ncbi:MAG: serine/threonine protein kinase, partial [Myxococcales bacterium]|nr:serine/threonine protein kinase [Myxococcales bacterium]
MREQQSIGIGTELAGRYELVSEIARGAMGDVYRATDNQEGLTVAVKILRAEYLTDEAMRRRFRREGAVLKALDHPSIVRLLDLEIDETGLVFLVTELVEGPTLAERLAEGPIDLESASQLVTALCDALTAAHDHGVLHGDLKPANILWLRPVPRLVDFGASKVLGLDRLTATGEVAGTPAS